MCAIFCPSPADGIIRLQDSAKTDETLQNLWKQGEESYRARRRKLQLQQEFEQLFQGEKDDVISSTSESSFGAKTPFCDVTNANEALLCQSVGHPNTPVSILKVESGGQSKPATPGSCVTWSADLVSHGPIRSSENSVSKDMKFSHTNRSSSSREGERSILGTMGHTYDSGHKTWWEMSRDAEDSQRKISLKSFSANSHGRFSGAECRKLRVNALGPKSYTSISLLNKRSNPPRGQGSRPALPQKKRAKEFTLFEEDKPQRPSLLQIHKYRVDSTNYESRIEAWADSMEDFRIDERDVKPDYFYEINRDRWVGFCRERRKSIKSAELKKCIGNLHIRSLTCPDLYSC